LREALGRSTRLRLRPVRLAEARAPHRSSRPCGGPPDRASGAARQGGASVWRPGPGRLTAARGAG
jgi:hypothetical protein